MEKLFHVKAHMLTSKKIGLPIRLITILLFIATVPFCLHAQENRRAITGTVFDERGEAVIGANVVEKGTTNGIITNVDGNFTLSVNEGATLQISYIGYVAQEVPVGSRNNLFITMKEDARALNDVVVVGYGTMRQKDLTGSISHINAEKLAYQRPTTVQDIIRNTAPGLIVGPSSSSAKESPEFLIRGNRTLIDKGNAPMVVLNGVPFNGELSEINPVDIESVDVLKDASSAAIYGAKSANGVIIITTKKGRGDKPTVQFDASVGFATMGAVRKYYKPGSYLDYRSDYATSSNGFENKGYYSKPTAENLQKYNLTEEQWRNYDAIGQGSGNMEDVWLQRIGLGDIERSNYFAGNTYDWFDATWQTGLRQNYNASLSGQTSNVNYYWSLGYQDNEGNQVGDRFKNYRTNLRLDAKVTSFLEVGTNLLLQSRDEGFQNVDWEKMCKNSPYATPYYEDGSLNPWPMGQGHQAPGENSFYNLSMSSKSSRAQTVTANFYGKIKLPFNISYQFTFAPRYGWTQKRDWTSSESVFDTKNGEASRETAHSLVWTLDNIVKWNYTFAEKHMVDVTLLQSAEKYEYWQEKMEASKFTPTDILQWHYMQPASEKSISSNDEKSTGDALMARLFYSYDDRYMLTASVRRDGYSAFGRSNPRATFPSLALAWNFTNENFFDWASMNNGKLRVSWGKNGNRQVKIYQALSVLTTNGISKYTYATPAGTLYELSTLQIGRMENRDLKWESTASWNVGLDFGFLNNRLSGSVEWYNMPTTDLLMDRTLPDLTGYTTVVTNLGKVVNKGFEISLNSINMERENFEWSTTFGLSRNRNKIEHLYYTYEDVLDDKGNIIGSKEVDDSGKGWFIGRDMSTIWDHKFIGIWQEEEAEEAAKYGQRPGDAKALDVNGDYRISQEDRVFLGQKDPKVRLSLSNQFVLFRDWDFSFNLYSYLGHKDVDNRDYLNNLDFTADYYNSPVRKYWTPENRSNDFARLKSTIPSGVEPKKVISKDFIRLENISVGYRVPQKVNKLLRTQDIRLYGTIRNVAVWAFSKDWSKANYWDVETGGSMPRTYTLGASVTF